MTGSSIIETTSRLRGDTSPFHCRKYFIVVNKQAGNYFRWFIQPRLGEFLSTEGIEGQVHYFFNTHLLKQKLETAQQEGFRCFIVVGGDGTINLVASLLRHEDCVMGIIPTGTSNMLAQMLQIPLNTRRAFGLLLAPTYSRSLDALKIGERMFFLNASVGLSSFSISDLRTVEKTYLKLLAYVFAVARSMHRAQTRDFRVTIDGKEHHIQAAELFVDNVGALWKPRHRTSEAQLDDGLAAACYVQKGTTTELFNAALDVILVRKKRQSIRYVASGKSISIDCDETMPVQADGDAITCTPVHISVVPAAARFIVRPPEQSRSD
ncbi:MAG: hypothetical protein E4G93_04230 [Dehalococcoidia bacterium]|nr:MAG: hypothetical protein E4G93_04230 [Dehalococcoidia bacterium]